MAKSNEMLKGRETIDRDMENKVNCGANAEVVEIGHMKPPQDEKDLSSKSNLQLDGLPLSDSVVGLSDAVKELKNQLMHIMGVNEVLESDLVNARKVGKEQLGERENYINKIDHLEQEVVSMGDLRLELAQIKRDRDRMAEKAQDLGEVLTSSELRVQELGQLLDKFWAERNDAHGEAKCLDTQFSRAMKVIEGLRTELNSSQYKEKEIESRIEPLKEQLKAAILQRDTFKTELIESRNTLEEIRQSILDASRETASPMG